MIEKQYKWCHRVMVQSLDEALISRVVIKTDDDEWIGTSQPIAIFFSVHSAFHLGEAGECKVKALITAIRSQVKGEVFILISEGAHVYTQSLKYENSTSIALSKSLADGKELVRRFKGVFEGYSVVYWTDFIQGDPNYESVRFEVRRIYREDSFFRQLIHADAEGTYTQGRALEYPDKKEYLEKTVEDMLEQCVSVRLLGKKGIRFHFYPGKFTASWLYVLEECKRSSNSTKAVHAFISTEKKIKVPLLKPKPTPSLATAPVIV